MKEPPYQQPAIDGTGSNVNPPVEVHRDASFARVARYFFALEDVAKVTVLVREYVSVDATRLPPR